MLLSKLFKNASIKVMSVLASLTIALGVGATISTAVINHENEAVETKADAAATRARIYVNLSWTISGPYGGNSDWPDQWGTAISADASTTHMPASGTSVCSTWNYVYDFSGGQNYLNFTFYQDDVRWIPYRNGQSSQSASAYNNSLGLDDSFSGYFGNGYIYYLTSIGYKNEGWYWDGKDNKNRTMKWFTYALTTNGVIVHYDLDGGSFSDSSSEDVEAVRLGSMTLPAAPTKSGYTFMGWQSSVDDLLFSGGASFTPSEPTTFTAIWHSNSIPVVKGDCARVVIGYNCNSFSSSSLMYYGSGVSTKLWIHQYSNNVSDGTEEVISATGTYYNSNEPADDTILSGCPRRFDYFDVPLSYFASGYYATVQRFSSSSWTNNSGEIQLSNSSTWAFKILYVQSTWENTPVLSAVTNSKGHAMLAAIGLSGMHTCSSNVLNGYGGLSYWTSTYITSKGVTVSSLSSYTITDFAYGADNEGDYTSAGSGSTATNAYTKYQWVANNGINPSSAKYIGFLNRESPISVTLWIVLSCGLAGLVGIGAFYFVNKKKKRNED